MNQVSTLFNSVLSLVISSVRSLMPTTQTPVVSVNSVKKRKTKSSRSTVGQTESSKTNNYSKILDPNWSKFQYVPASKTDLRESMERYKRMANAGGSRTVRPGEETASNEQTDRGVLLDFTKLREPVVANVKKNRG